MTSPTQAPRPPTATFRNVHGVEIAFSPRGDCEAIILAALAGAKTSIEVQAYEFASKAIFDALAAAMARGVPVRAIFDKQNALPATFVGMHSLMPQLRTAGAQVMLDYHAHIAHNKVMIVDAAIVITGSFNFTDAAQFLNAENLLAIHDARIAAEYQRNFDWRWSLSKSP